MRFVCLTAVVVTVLVATAQAEQPVFDEMPRWTGGWGYQVLQEYRYENGLYDGNQSLGSGLDRSAHILHVQGYTLGIEAFVLLRSFPWFLRLNVEVYPRTARLYSISKDAWRYCVRVTKEVFQPRWTKRFMDVCASVNRARSHS